MKTSNRLRVIRADKRITQEALEAKTRNKNISKRPISQTRISCIENGDSAEEWEQKAIARALRVPVQEVFPVPEQVAS